MFPQKLVTRRRYLDNLEASEMFESIMLAGIDV